MITLIKEINETLEQKIATAINETTQAVACIESNTADFDKNVALFETAEEFLAQLAAMVGAGKVDPTQVDRYASELATLQLLSQEDTKGALLSRFKGDPTQNLATIMKGVSKPSDAPGKVDTMLIQVAQQNGKSLADSNKQTLSQVEQMSPEQKQQFVRTLQKLTTYYRQAAANTQQAPNPKVASTPQPDNQNQTPATAGGGQVGTPAAGAGSPAGV